MKSSRKIVVALAALSTALALVACSQTNGPKNEADANTVQIYAWDSGLGTAWLSQIVDDFNASQTDYKAVLTTNNSLTTITNTLELGAAGNPYDLYFSYLGSFSHYDEFASLDDVLNSKASDDESVLIKDKLYSGFYDASKDSDGVHKFMYYGNNATGIAYNRSLISDDQVPNTTDELESLVTDLVAEGVTPWLFFNEPSGGSNGYWNYVLDAWAMQYSGLDYYYNTLMQLKGDDGTSPSKAAFEKKDGRYQALEVMEKILTPTTTHKQCTNTNFTTVQTLFLEGQAAMNINGAWLLNENNSTADISMMKTPVISSIVETLDDTSMSDATLSAIVDEIDNGATSSTLCDEHDFARIKEARGVYTNNCAEQYIFSPNYSNAREATTAFLRFYSTDASIMRYINALHLPATMHLTDDSKIPLSTYAAWNQRCFEIANQGNPLLTPVKRSRVFKNYSINIMNNVLIAQSLIAANPVDRRNADEIWSTFVDSVEENWEGWIQE